MSYLITFMLISFLILIHELGHFIAAIIEYTHPTIFRRLWPKIMVLSNGPD